MEEANQLASKQSRNMHWDESEDIGKGDKVHCAAWRDTASTYFLGNKGVQWLCSWNTRKSDADPVSSWGRCFMQHRANLCQIKPICTRLDSQGRISKVHLSRLQRESLWQIQQASTGLLRLPGRLREKNTDFSILRLTVNINSISGQSIQLGSMVSETHCVDSEPTCWSG